MSDVADERLIVLAERAKAPPNTSQEIYAGELASLVDEIQRRRAEQPARREHVERVVLEAIAALLLPEGIMLGRFGLLIARRVADRLSVPVLSEEDVLSVLEDGLDGYGLHTGGSYGVECDHEGKMVILAGIAKRIAAGKP